MRFITLFIFGFIILLSENYLLSANKDTLNQTYKNSLLNNHRFAFTLSGQTVLYTGSMIWLHYAWYQDHPRSSFQFHDDAKDWKQLDKWGHLTSAYHISNASHKTYMWAGLSNKQSAVFGSILSTLFMTTIEVFDGFSKEWGFSWSDQAANLAGTSLFLWQQLAWEEQKIKPRYSFRKSDYTDYRPDLFGSNYLEYPLKDYNGMTFWLSASMNLFSKNDIFPSWLNIAIGQGATGMLGSVENPHIHNGIVMPAMDRYRQWYLSPDIDLSQIETDSQFLQVLFSTLDFIKFPTPALEYNKIDGWRLHFVFF